MQVCAHLANNDNSDSDSNIQAGVLSSNHETTAWICAQGLHYSLPGPGGEQASAAPGEDRSRLGIDVSRTHSAYIYIYIYPRASKAISLAYQFQGEYAPWG